MNTRQIAITHGDQLRDGIPWMVYGTAHGLEVGRPGTCKTVCPALKQPDFKLMGSGGRS